MSNLFKIGTAGGSLTLLSDLGIFEPYWEMIPFTDEKDLSNAMVLGAGWKAATWHWGFITYDMYDALKVYCPGKSSNVEIKTKITTEQYDGFTAVMVWPKEEDWHNNKILDIEIKFQNLGTS
jgi:hypothetical protein